MRRFAFALAVLLLFAPMTVFAADGETVIGTDDENIVYMGRWEKDENGLMRGAFECGLVLRFTGTGIKLNGSASGTALIAVDGGEAKEKNLTENGVLFSGLQDGEHTLELYAAAQRTFPTLGGFALDAGGKTLPSPAGKMIEFIGDSITEGYVAPADAKNNMINSYGNSYAFIVGRRLLKEYGIRFNTIAYGGIAIAERGENDLGTDPLGMPERYFLNHEYMMKASSDEERAAAQRWDVSKYTPDFIVINLGTNDTFSKQDVIKTGTVSFLKELCASYEKAYIFVMTPFNNNNRAVLRRAVYEADDERVILITTKDWKIEAGSDWLHPAPDQHIRAAELLYETLKPYIEAADGQTETETETETEPVTETETTETVTAKPETDGEQTKEQEDGAEKKTFSFVPFIIAAVCAAAAAVTAVLIIKKRKK